MRNVRLYRAFATICDLFLKKVLDAPPKLRIILYRSRIATILSDVKMAEQPQPRQYLYTSELAQFVPWSEDAIEKKIARGVLKRGVHFFYLDGRRLFKWSAIVALIEKPEEPDLKADSDEVIPMLRGGTLGDGPKT